ncbi:hypothetical protein, partial [Klebsiella pneumoniae]
HRALSEHKTLSVSWSHYLLCRQTLSGATPNRSGGLSQSRRQIQPLPDGSAPYSLELDIQLSGATAPDFSL